MKVLHVINSLDKSSGTTVFICNLCNYLSELGISCGILVNKKNPNEIILMKNIFVYEGLSCLQTLPLPDIVHIHALWSPFLHRIQHWAETKNIPIVISPHGMLTPWALNQKKIKKMIAMVCYQYGDLKRASLFHATAQSEIDDLRRLKLTNPFCIAPLGVGFPEDDKLKKNSGKRPPKKRTLLFLSRVHPKKGLIHLVDAWVQIKQRRSDDIETKMTEGWQVVVAGPSEVNHTKEVMAYVREKGVTEDFQMLGAVYGHAKDELYKNADIFVLPSFSENFGSVVIEALAWGCPVITTKGTPWQELETHQCGKWIDIGVEPLTLALKEMMGLSERERKKMGQNGRNLVERQYSWESVADKIRNAYENLLGTYDKGE